MCTNGMLTWKYCTIIYWLLNIKRYRTAEPQICYFDKEPCSIECLGQYNMWPLLNLLVKCWLCFPLDYRLKEVFTIKSPLVWERANICQNPRKPKYTGEQNTLLVSQIKEGALIVKADIFEVIYSNPFMPHEYCKCYLSAWF